MQRALILGRRIAKMRPHVWICKPALHVVFCLSGLDASESPGTKYEHRLTSDLWTGASGAAETDKQTFC